MSEKEAANPFCPLYIEYKDDLSKKNEFAECQKKK
jgi:hypothetical protein